MDNADSDAAPYHSCISMKIKIQGIAMLFYRKRMAVLFCVYPGVRSILGLAEIIAVKEGTM